MCAVQQHQENMERTFPCGFKMARGVLKRIQEESEDCFFSAASAEHALAAKFEF